MIEVKKAHCINHACRMANVQAPLVDVDNGFCGICKKKLWFRPAIVTHCHVGAQLSLPFMGQEGGVQ